MYIRETERFGTPLPGIYYNNSDFHKVDRPKCYLETKG